jgi:hypothetical protein
MSEAAKHDFERVLRMHKNKGLDVRMESLSGPDWAPGDPYSLRENIEHFVSDIGIGQKLERSDAAANTLTDLSTIWTQLANALAPISTPSRSQRKPGAGADGTHSDQILAAAQKGEAQARANALEHSDPLQVNTSQLAFDYTPPEPENGNELSFYCELRIYAHNDTNLLGCLKHTGCPSTPPLIVISLFITLLPKLAIFGSNARVGNQS